MDKISIDDDINLTDIRRKVTILPFSHIGSPCHIKGLMQDTMTIVRKYSKPDLFITFTYNPRWVEVQ